MERGRQGSAGSPGSASVLQPWKRLCLAALRCTRLALPEYSHILPSPPAQELGWSAEESFVSPPAVGPDATVRLLAVADLGQAEVDGCVLQCKLRVG